MQPRAEFLAAHPDLDLGPVLNRNGWPPFHALPANPAAR
jgi:hypothetical protein